MRKRDLGENPSKKVGNRIINGGPTLKKAFFRRGYTVLSFTLPPFINSKLSYIANIPENLPKKASESKMLKNGR